jgi:putative ABC transport system substrate-binding protein
LAHADIKANGKDGRCRRQERASQARIGSGPGSIALASDLHLPAIYPFRYFAVNGGYGFDTVAPYRDVASYVDRILKGEKPGNLPVQAPTKYELVINLKTAKALGLAISPEIQLRADELIE